MKHPLPSWLNPNDYIGKRMNCEEAMDLAIELSLKNVENKSGGPFGAVILSKEGLVVSIGVNMVISLKSSMYHAEVVAIFLAHEAVDNFRLDGGYLVSSSQPCCMCYGSLFWSGINHLVVGARKEDVENHTEFDEGPIPEDWKLELTSRGIQVTTDVLRQKATQALIDYSDVHY